jgi:hypothetical protein
MGNAVIPDDLLAAIPGEILHLWWLIAQHAEALDGGISRPGAFAADGVPHCWACGSAAFQDLTPPGAAVVHLLKCLRCGRRWLLGGEP